MIRWRICAWTVREESTTRTRSLCGTQQSKPCVNSAPLGWRLSTLHPTTCPSVSVSIWVQLFPVWDHQPGMYVAWDRIYTDRLRHLSNMETMDWEDTLTVLFYCPQQNSVTAATSWTWRRTCARSVPTPNTARRTRLGRSSVSPAPSPRTRPAALYRLNWGSTSPSAPLVSTSDPLGCTINCNHSLWSIPVSLSFKCLPAVCCR